MVIRPTIQPDRFFFKGPLSGKNHYGKNAARFRKSAQLRRRPQRNVSGAEDAAATAGVLDDEIAGRGDVYGDSCDLAGCVALRSHDYGPAQRGEEGAPVVQDFIGGAVGGELCRQASAERGEQLGAVDGLA